MKLLIFSDIHSDLAALRKLINTEADLYIAAGDLVNWARGLDKTGEILKERADRMYVMPGNHESEQDIVRFCEQYGLHNIHGQHIQAGRYQVAGLGCSNPTPFDTPGELSETEIASRLATFEPLDPLVLICHCPPKDSPLDRAGEGKHFGSTAVRNFLQRKQPDYFFCGHIHEAAGVWTNLGRTKALNVGKTGYLLEID